MRLWSFLLIVTLIGSGFLTGYVAKQRALSERNDRLRALATQTPAAREDPQPAGYDPSLVLPPPDAKGIILEPALGIIQDHFFNERYKSASENGAIGGQTASAVPEALSPVPTFQQVGALAPLTADTPPFILGRGKDAAPIPQNMERPELHRFDHGVATIRLPAPDSQDDTADDRCVYTNNREIALDFAVGRIGTAGVQAVELWARRSPNAEYECVDRMVGDKAPFATRLWSEGRYEFRLVFESGTGVKTPPPSRAAAPDLCVCLDTTKPQVEILPPVPSTTGILSLCWKADDKNLEEDSIRVEYSVDGNTWQPIASDEEWLPNTGVQPWKVPPGLPNHLHLRVLARDKAGNIGEARTPSMVCVDSTVPVGRIRGIWEVLPAPKQFAAAEIASEICELRSTSNSAMSECLPMPRQIAREQAPELLPLPSLFHQPGSR